MNVSTSYLNLNTIISIEIHKSSFFIFVLFYHSYQTHIRKHINSASYGKSVYNKTEQGNCVYRKKFSAKSSQYSPLKLSVHTFRYIGKVENESPLLLSRKEQV